MVAEDGWYWSDVEWSGKEREEQQNEERKEGAGQEERREERETGGFSRGGWRWVLLSGVWRRKAKRDGEKTSRGDEKEEWDEGRCRVEAGGEWVRQ